jgi:hypothetical protein
MHGAMNINFDIGCGGSFFSMIQRPGFASFKDFRDTTSLHLLSVVVNRREDFSSVLRQHSDAVCRFIASRYCVVTPVLVSRCERNSEPLPSVWETLVLSRVNGQFGCCQNVWLSLQCSGWNQKRFFSVVCFCLDGNGSCAWRFAVFAPQFRIQYYCWLFC